MTERPDPSLRWHIKEDGSGTAHAVSIVDGDKVIESSYTFDSLDRADQIPPDVANVIRNDGRTSGQIP